jgi:hypothetical protein
MSSGGDISSDVTQTHDDVIISNDLTCVVSKPVEHKTHHLFVCLLKELIMSLEDQLLRYPTFTSTFERFIRNQTLRSLVRHSTAYVTPKTEH